MRTRKIWAAMGFMLAVAAPAFGDTPIGPGVTGSGGTGANRSDDPSTGAGPGTEVRQGDRQRNPSAAAKAGGDVSGGAKAAGSSAGATGATSGAATSGSAGANVKGGASGGTQY